MTSLVTLHLCPDLYSFLHGFERHDPGIGLDCSGFQEDHVVILVIADIGMSMIQNEDFQVRVCYNMIYIYDEVAVASITTKYLQT